jgi:hypothetical protein
MRKGFEHEMEFWQDFVKTERFRDQLAERHPQPGVIAACR